MTMLASEATRTRPKAREFRPEIQGLRAIGAILVATYHIWVERVSGGVDVFFVISGFLVLGALVEQADRTGRIDLMKFGTGIATRLLPLSLLVIASVMVLTVFLMPLTRWHPIITESAASALSLENWKLAYSAVDYLDRDEAASPFQHYWAVSIQAQIYVIFGLLIAALTQLKTMRRGPVNLTYAVPLAVVFAVSLVYSVYVTETNQAFAYFNTFARVWEFALGGLVAIALPTLKLPLALRIALGWIGVAAVLSCGVLLNVSTVFPGYAALWPTLGAAMVIVAGHTKSPIAVDRILAWAPLAYVGKISYALYLWHWPILVFYLVAADTFHAGFLGGLAVFAISIVLAGASTWLIEERGAPKRPAGGKARPSLVKIGAAATGIVFTAGAAFAAEAYWISHERAIDTRNGRYPGALAFDNPDRGVLTAPLIPGPLWVRKDRAPVYDDGCHQSLTGTAPISCVYGSEAAAHTIAVVGGSHSAHWIPGLIELFKNTDWKIVTYTKSSCLFVAEPFGGSCERWNERVLEELMERKPDAVFMTSTRAVSGREDIPAGWQERTNQLIAAGIHVIAIRDTPWMQFDVAECVSKYGPAAQACGRPRSAKLAAEDPTRVLPPSPKLHLIDANDRFCDEMWCYPVSGNVMMYHDEHHISATYSRTLAPTLAKLMMPTIHQIEDEARNKSLLQNAAQRRGEN